MKEKWAPPNEPSTAAELHQFQPWNPTHLSCKHSLDGIFSRYRVGCSSVPRMSFPPPSLMDKETAGTGEFSLWPEWEAAAWNHRRRTEREQAETLAAGEEICCCCKSWELDEMKPFLGQQHLFLFFFILLPTGFGRSSMNFTRGVKLMKHLMRLAFLICFPIANAFHRLFTRWRL